MKLVSDMVEGMELDPKLKLELCAACIHGKQHRTPLPVGETTRAKELLEIVHTDVCGPMSALSFGKARYFITFTDDKSRKTFVYFVK